MTVSTTTSRIVYAGNGVTTIFAFPYRFLVNGDLELTLFAADGTSETLVLTTDYTVTGADSDAGGSVTMVVAPAVGETLVIRRIVDLTQETDYISGDAFPAESHERALDKLTMSDQQLQEQVDRSLTVPLDDVTFSGQLPPIVAERFLRINDSGTAIELVDALNAGELVVSPFIETLLDDANAAAARTTLGAQAAGSYAASGAVGSSGLTMATARILGRDTAGTGAVEELTGTEVRTLAGLVIGTDVLAPNGNGASLTGVGRRLGQIVSSFSGANNSTANTIPWDDTIPQSSEGLEFFSLAITPANASSLLEIHVEFQGTSSSVAQIIVALFKDSETDARAAVDANVGVGAGQPTKLMLTYHMTAGSTSAMTFKVRAGAATGSLTINGTSGARKLGGVLVSGITIKEYLPA